MLTRFEKPVQGWHYWRRRLRVQTNHNVTSLEKEWTEFIKIYIVYPPQWSGLLCVLHCNTWVKNIYLSKAPKITSLLKALYTGTKASIKNTVHSFQVHTGCRQGGIESPVLFNIYMDFVLRCVEHEVLLKYPNTGLKYSYRIKSESSNRKQRSIHKISGNDRLRMLLYADDIVLFCEDINELNDI